MRNKYKLRPIETSSVELDDDVHCLIELLVRNAHALWAEQRIHEGWTWGPSRCDKSKRHPCLRPFEELPESEKEYDKKMVVGTVKTLMALGYRIEKG